MDSVPGYSELGKVQHGCIDCFAMMICAELQSQSPVPSSEESPVELSAQRTQTDLVDELPQFKELEATPLSQKLKFIEELPEAEQLKKIKENRLVEETSVQGKGQTGLSANRRHPKLIEELSDSESVLQADFGGNQPTA